jgi:hypothetical protein
VVKSARTYCTALLVKLPSPRGGGRREPGGRGVDIDTPDLRDPIFPGGRTLGQVILPSSYRPAVNRAYAAQQSALKRLERNKC